ncbi:MAG: hypothetical protein M3Y08_06170 [Fibrobacterota bacterium]|nr:hypothetical protein [Fibrobacterota bacterium]
MKKTFMALLVSAVAVWGYVLMQIVMVLMGKTAAMDAADRLSPLPMVAQLTRPRPPLDTTFRDPFQSYLYAQKPAPTPATGVAHIKATSAAIVPPSAILTGILWGDEPVAILKQEGQTELVKKGAEIWGLKVLRIEKNQVVVMKQGRQFTLGY